MQCQILAEVWVNPNKQHKEGAKNKRIIRNSNFAVIQYNKNKIPFSYLNLTKSQTTGNFFNDGAKKKFF
jgi:hypothetical protein